MKTQKVYKELVAELCGFLFIKRYTIDQNELIWGFSFLMLCQAFWVLFLVFDALLTKEGVKYVFENNIQKA